MNPKYRNIFLFIGVAAIVLMLFFLDMSWEDLLRNIRRAGIWLPAVIVLWGPIYMINAKAWQVIINNGEEAGPSYWRILKLTISGYALNYVTPVGLLGGEPYRVMELTSDVGATRATSSVILYSMMHIFSHFCFWTFGIILFLCIYWSQMTVAMAIILFALALFSGFGIHLFLLGYRNGLVRRTLSLLSRLPFVGKRIGAFGQRHEEAIVRTDTQIAALHSQRRSTFYISLALEFGARLLGCVEIMFILFVFTTDVNFWDCVLFQAFSSLFANLMFFIPMQMGTREGSMALICKVLSMKGAYGVLTGLMTRLRELVWIAIGLALIRVGNKKD